MKIIPFCLLVLCATSAHAQRFSVGARTGIGTWNNGAFGFSDNRATIWEREVFVRYQTKKAFAFEAGFFQEDGPNDLSGLSTIRVHFYGGNLRAMYGFGIAHIPGLRNYAGVVLAQGAVVSDLQGVRQGASGEQLLYLERHVEYSQQAGVEDMLEYRLAKRFSIHLIGSYRKAFMQNGPCKGLTAQFGTSILL